MRESELAEELALAAGERAREPERGAAADVLPDYVHGANPEVLNELMQVLSSGCACRGRRLR